MRTLLAVAFGSVVTSLLGCPRKAGDEVTRPADSVASSKASEAPLPPPVVAVSDEKCLDGALRAVPAAVGGFGDGIGLGTVGGFSGIGPKVSLRGQTLRVIGLPPADAEKTVCDAYGTFKPCFESVVRPDGEVTFGMTLKLAADGSVAGSEPLGGTLVDEKAQACLREAVQKLTFAPPTKNPATVSYAFAAKPRKPAVAVKMIEVETSVTGRLPPEVIKRIIRANFPRLRACYEAGLKKDRGLEGTVATKLVIDTDGSVESAKYSGGSLPDETVQSCVVAVFASLAFPEPEGGKVSVTYPIDFQNDE